jgi:hypothetical protein
VVRENFKVQGRDELFKPCMFRYAYWKGLLGETLRVDGKVIPTRIFEE